MIFRYNSSVSLAARPIIELSRGDDGLFIEPDYRDWSSEDKAEYENKEEERRKMFSVVFDFGDATHNPETWDPSGDHNCGKCNKQYEGQKSTEDLGHCVLLPILVEKDCGSCRRYENKSGRAFDPEVITALNPQSATPELMAYGVSLQAYEAKKNGESTEGKVFGCCNCPFMKKSYEPDSAGRSYFCSQGLFRLDETNCCAINGAETADVELISIYHDEGFKESDHPRVSSGPHAGEFTSGGGSSSKSTPLGNPKYIETDEGKKRVSELYQSGKSTGEIARQIGWPQDPSSRKKIRSFLRSQGVYKELGGKEPIDTAPITTTPQPEVAPEESPLSEQTTSENTYNPVKTQKAFESRIRGRGVSLSQTKKGISKMIEGGLHHSVVEASPHVVVTDRIPSNHPDANGLYNNTDKILSLRSVWDQRGGIAKPDTFIHEYGHHLTLNLGELERRNSWDSSDVSDHYRAMIREYREISQEAEQDLERNHPNKSSSLMNSYRFVGKKVSRKVVSNYSLANEGEWMAEGFMFYFRGEGGRQMLKEKQPRTYEFMEKLTTNGFKKKS